MLAIIIVSFCGLQHYYCCYPRYLGLISHLDITLPAPGARCCITLRDGQGQELTSTNSPNAANAAPYSDPYSLSDDDQQQQGASDVAAVMAASAGGGGLRSWQRLEVRGVVPDKLLVLKEPNATGLACLRQEIGPGILHAWLKHLGVAADDALDTQVSACVDMPRTCVHKADAINQHSLCHINRSICIAGTTS